MNKKFDLYVKNFELETDFNDKNEDIIRIKGFANKYIDSSNSNIVVDRSNESVLPSAYRLDNYMKNPILLYQHNQDQPIGKVININLSQKGLEVEAEVYKEANPAVFTLIKNKILRAFSIGFQGKDFHYDEVKDIWYWTNIELLEISIVSVPDNQDSLFTELLDAPCQEGVCLLGIKNYNKKSGETMTKKEIKNKEISTKDWGSVDKTKLGQDLAELGKSNYINEAYLVVGDVEKRSTWKFPHHEYNGKDLIVNKGGVVSAYEALQGARNTPDISAEEKTASAKHLLKHYKELKAQEMIGEIPSELEDMAKGIIVTETKEAKTKETDNDNSETKETDNDNSETKETDNDNSETKETQELTKEEVEQYFTEQTKSEEGLNTLLDLYSKLESTVNESLQAYLEENKD